MSYGIKCCSCGRFMTPGPGSSWVFVPDSYLSYEENFWQCTPCTEKHGPIAPQQNVVVEMCSGIVRATNPTNEGQP